MYASLANGGSMKGVTLVNRDTLARMAAVSSASALDAVILTPTRLALGYVKTTDNRRVPGCTENDSVIISEEAFRHTGFGGAMAFAELAAGMSFGYAFDSMADGRGCNARVKSMATAAYAAEVY